MWTVEDIEEYCNEVSMRMGQEFTCPVKINGRLTSTLGRVKYIGGEPYVLEISKSLLETSSEDSIKSVIEHEVAHWLSWYMTGEMHGHDEVFKGICAKIGCSFDKARTNVERIVAPNKIYKYSVYCPNCGYLGGYHRMCRTLKEIDYCTCNKCHSGDLWYKQNR